MPPQILPILGSSGSSSGTKMQSRDHPFNRSTRPLLERRAQPQVMVTAKKQYHQYGGVAAPPMGHQGPVPAIPTRGYNDFNLISRQYETWNSNHSHSGYPYGSPPSPTADVVAGGAHPDFQFSDIAGHQRTLLHQYTVNSNNSDDDEDDDYDELVYHHNQLNAASPAGLKVANQQLRRRLLDAASPTPPAPPQRTALHHRTPPPPPRRTDSPPSTNPADIDGPFVFGVHHPNTFTPAYGANATLYGAGTVPTKLGVGKDVNGALHSSPDSSQGFIAPSEEG
uniref:Uncharacterized protein n=1 Tax=Anopheles dirus TaxID=7168 RepID=A0A182N6T4_9DIPT